MSEGHSDKHDSHQRHHEEEEVKKPHHNCDDAKVAEGVETNSTGEPDPGH